MTDREQIEVYARCVYDESDLVEIRHGREAINISVWCTASGLPGIYGQLKRLNDDRKNLHPGVLPRKDRSHGGAKNCAPGRVVWLDFDKTDADTVQRALVTNGLPPPSMMLNSGHGVHVYWRLDRKYSLDELQAVLDTIKAVGRAGVLPIDTACADLARIMRLPGFTNWKTPAAPCCIIEPMPDPCAEYTLDTLKECFTACLPQSTTPAEATQSPASEQMPAGQGTPTAGVPAAPSTVDIAILRAKASDYIDKIPGVVTGGRNNEVYKVACDVFDFGLSEDVVLEYMLKWNERNMPPLPDAEVENVVRSAEKNRQNKTQTKGLQTKAPDQAAKATAPATAPAEPAEPLPAPAQVKQIIFPEECYDVPGFVNEFQKYALSTAAAKCKLAAFAAGLALQAMLIGKKTYLDAEERTHSNCYIILLAPSGSGKDAPRKAIKRIIAAVKKNPEYGNAGRFEWGRMLDERISDGFASGEGIVTGLYNAGGSKLYLTDEIDTLMNKLRPKRYGEPSMLAQEQQRILLSMYSSATSTFYPSDRANPKNRLPAIENPNLCIYGTGTPGAFYKALNVGALTNGLIGRFIVFESTEPIPPPEPLLYAEGDENQTDTPPDSLVNTAYQWLKYEQLITIGGNPDSVVAMDSIDGPERRAIHRDAAATDLMNKYRLWNHERITEYNKQHGPENLYSTVWRRYAETRNKLCMIYATSKAGMKIDTAVVDAECVQWADKVARHCCQVLAQQADENVAENDFDEWRKKVLAHLAKKGGETTKRDIFRNPLQTLKPRDRQEVLDALERDEERIKIEVRGKSTIVTLLDPH